MWKRFEDAVWYCGWRWVVRDGDGTCGRAWEGFIMSKLFAFVVDLR